MMRTDAMAVLVAVTVAVATFGVVPAAGGAGSAGASAAASPHGSATNFTITLSSHQPGAEEVTMSQYAANLQANLEWWNWLTVASPAEQGSTCATTDARAAGIDRDNDDPGTQTDDTFIGKYSEDITHENSEGQNVTSYDFYDPDSFEGESTYLHDDDQIVAQIANCYTNPETPGWYRWWGYVNGTTDGTKDGEFDETNAYSHWYYICDCESYDDAVETLGAPDTSAAGEEESDGQAGSIPNGPTGPWNLYYAGGSDDGGSTPTATPDGSSTPTATATATATQNNGGGGATATATATQNNGGGGATATATDGAGGPATTTTGQPGFGVAVALVALAGAALLAFRRR